MEVVATEFGSNVQLVTDLRCFAEPHVESSFKSPHGVDSQTPALVIPLSASHRHCIQEEPVINSIEFGSIQTEYGYLMSIKLRLEETQVIALPDLCDFDVWGAIWHWRRRKVVPVVFGTEHGSKWRYRFAMVKMPQEELAITQLAMSLFPQGQAEGLYDEMVKLAEANTWLARNDSSGDGVCNSLAFPHPRSFTFMGMFSEKKMRTVS
ncbi:hypothetical protein [Pandoraea apista]|uniref:hypothetical protein n=1 Tax=Pandoraea apista TaxID=93218 RepID=UPI00058A8D55|nr:hypothetical protein [Pandoraea apista]AJE98833.1 hypothetical protein SG18_12705 [Pandoraea apista]AKH72913.1 hypothetical protein XM39_12905 [Pandoraea apista]AKI61298.1 hypothetical protein AA956_05160 [Pandoraea apista]